MYARTVGRPSEYHRRPMQIYDTLARTPKDLVPRDSGRVGMYVCGATVQSRPHLGHGRYAVVFDVVLRYLEWLGYEVTYVRNVTDVDDKIIAAAAERGISIDAVADEATRAFEASYAALNVRPADVEPRATDHIAEMIALVERLITSGHAYESGGDVYFAVRSFPGYGSLSGRNIDDLVAGARVAPDERKRDPLDFALWKASKPGEPSWDSRWGPGRPGWHIECSAMAEKYLGFGFDIHGGGNDLIFPHHENERAQSEAAAGRSPFANFWMHNGMVTLEGEKMSKSLGNFFTVREVRKAYSRPDVLRMFVLSSHYRSPLNYALDQLDKAQADLTTLYTALRGVTLAPPGEMGGEYRQRFQDAMDDDFNTSAALAALFELAHELNRCKQADEAGNAATLAGVLKELGGVLGLLQEDANGWLQGRSYPNIAAGGVRISGSADVEFIPVTQGLENEQIESLIQKRLDARKSKNWTEADRIRDELKQAGVILEDTAAGTTWRRG